MDQKQNNSIKDLILSHKTYQILIISVLSLILIGIIVSFFLLRSSSYKTGDGDSSILVNIVAVNQGAPIFLENTEGNSIIIYDEQRQMVDPGDYTLRYSSDTIGLLTKEITIKESAKTTFKFNDTDFEEIAESPNSSALRLDNFAVNTTGEYLDQQVIDVANKGVDDFVESNIDGAITYAVVNTEIQESDNQTITGDLSLVTPNNELIEVTENCRVINPEFAPDGASLSYFQICEDGQNGMYLYDISSGQSTQLVGTSDLVNSFRLKLHFPSGIVVFTRDNGDFGFIRDGVGEVLVAGSSYVSPGFSPDYSKLLVWDESQNRTSDEGLYADFGVDILAVNFNDLIKNGISEEFRFVGRTYYIPRPDDLDDQAYIWESNTIFRSGDSDLIYSLDNKELDGIDQVSDVNNPGNLYSTSRGDYRLYQHNLFSGDQLIASNVDSVILVADQLYVLQNDYLYRIIDESLVQTYQDQILDYQIDGSNLNIIDINGNLAEYDLNQIEQ